MDKKIWFYLSIIQTIVLISILMVFILQNTIPVNFKETDISKHWVLREENDYLPNVGYIPDAKTAKIIGSCVIDNLTGYSRFRINSIAVEYDEENRIWLISKGYIFSGGGMVAIEQDSGKIIRAVLTKS